MERFNEVEQGREISGRMLKGLEIRKKNLEAKLTRIADDIAERKDDTIDFKRMGIDHLFWTKATNSRT